MSSLEASMEDGNVCQLHKFHCGVVVPDFLDDATCSHIRRDLEHAHWIEAQIGRYSGNTYLGSAPDPDLSTAKVTRKFTIDSIDIHRVRIEISKILERRFGFFPPLFSDYSVSKYLPGSRLGVHADTGVYNTKRIFTCIVYLSNDYRGGRILFPEIGVKFQPSAGDLLCFYSELRHSVEEVVSGERIALIMFAEDD